MALIEGASFSAIGTLDNLYSNNLTITVAFTYSSAGQNNLLSTSANVFSVDYNEYVNDLKADSASNPTTRFSPPQSPTFQRGTMLTAPRMCFWPKLNLRCSDLTRRKVRSP
jgi:hypothetical protein